jgi:hypothetical protein
MNMPGNLQASAILLAAVAVAGLAGAQSFPRADSVVMPKAFVSLQAVPQGHTAEIAVVGEIARGFHVNSNTPKDDYLIPTTVTAAQLPAGLRLGAITYPKGEMKRFAFSDAPLDVYERTFIVRLRVDVAKDAPVGPARLPLTLRYQACNDRACLPPVKLPVVVELHIAPAGTKLQGQHPNLFGKSSRK